MSEIQKTTIREIQQAVCAHYRIGRVDMLSKSRVVHLVEPRHIAMFLSRKLGERSWGQIGRAFGGRDHTTGIHATRKIAARVDAGDRETLNSLAAIKAVLGGSA